MKISKISLMYYKKEQVLSFTTVEEGQDGDMEGKPFTHSYK